jgi:DNA (cytosine-5)-methyltransferase 1
VTKRGSHLDRARPAQQAQMEMPAGRETLRAVDLFCGAGGLSEGLRQAGFEVVLGSDHDPDAVATYAANFPEAAAVTGDIRHAEVQQQIAQAAAGVDVVVGGPPCQAFSQVRNHSRLIDDPRNSLYREFVRAVGEIGPAAFIMENVPGLAQMGVTQQVIDDLSLEGEYAVTAQLADAADFGVPQARKRLLFLGVRRSLQVAPPVLQGSGATGLLHLARSPGPPARYAVAGRPADGAGEMLRRLADPADLTATTAAQAIGDLAHLQMGRRADTLERNLPAAGSAYQRLMRDRSRRQVQNVSVPRLNADTALRLAGIPAGGNHRDLTYDLQARYLTGERWGPDNGSGRLGRAHYYAYRRLHPDMWAWTLNTKADSAYHWAASRCLSVREFARLQSFPDRFVFTTDERSGLLPGRIDGGPAHSRYRQAGNAVPPLLAAAAAAAVRDAIVAARCRAA